MSAKSAPAYDPRTYKGLTFHDAVAKFRDGSDTPRAYLERCLATISEREPIVKAFAHLAEEPARAAANASTARWEAGKPLSAIDGMPVGIKDLLETKDMPTQMNCEAMSGNFPKRDNAAVWALREAGAIVFGKTVTAELGGSHPGPTTNPFDATRTPGGSSSGSAAAVASGMMPAAIGTQVGGSIIRPAAFCGNVALKPTQGAIHRGERLATSMSTHGAHANCIEDMWQVCIEIAKRTGGDRGCLGLAGPSVAPAAVKPQRLMVLESEGWAMLDEASKTAFEAVLESIQAAGIKVLRRRGNPYVEMIEEAVSKASQICASITGWENRWYQRNIVNEFGGGISARGMATLEKAEAMSPADYQRALLSRDQAQACHARVAPHADALISLSCPGPAPQWLGDKPGETLARRPTGDAIFNYASSMLFAPSVTMPLMSVASMPVGVQLIGQQHEDARMTSFAGWMLANIKPVVAA
jgi:Asp-tRNA(Asn)/Glu-tRNA(Gln) amidotransferase A subunit family amidase